MILTKKNLDKIADKVTRDLLCDPGLKYAIRVVTTVKKNLQAEKQRRKNL
jgi:hypothetical protein